MQEATHANLKTKGGTAIRGIVKWMLRNPYLRKPGLAIAFSLGFRGINRVQSAHFKYVRDYHGEKLGRKEIVLNSNGISRVFLKPRVSFNYNSRVNVGAALAAYLLSGSNLGSLTSPAVPKYIALSTSTLTPADTDTTLSGETTVAGLARALGTIQTYVAPTSLDGAASYEVYNQFTLTGSATTVVSTGLFDASSSGNLFAEVNFSSSASMSTNDILQTTWQINF